MVTPQSGGADGAEVTVELDPGEAMSGTVRTLYLPPDNRPASIRIPPGVGNDTLLRVPGIGPVGEDGVPGTVMVRVTVRPLVGMPYPPPTSGAPPYPPPTSGAPPYGTPPQHYGAQGFPAPGPYGYPGAAPVPDRSRRKPWLIAAAVVVALLAVVLIPRAFSGDGDPSPSPTTVAGGQTIPTTIPPTTATTTAPAVTTAAPVTTAQYQQALATLDQKLRPGFQKLGNARTPSAVSGAADELRRTIETEATRLRELTPPTAAENAHTAYVSSLDALATGLTTTSSEGSAQELCAGSSAVSRFSRSQAVAQARTAAQALSRADPAAAYKAGTFLSGPIKENSRRLGNGNFIKGGSRTGFGQLKITNGNKQDATIAIVPNGSKTPSVSVYVRASSSFTVRGIRDGTYRIYLTMGTDWDKGLKLFTRDCSFQQFDDTFPFRTTSTTYSGWEITLNPVVGGDATTSQVDPGAFPTG